jgi:hypothetical protein
MHVRHEELFTWLERSLPGSRLYGPYSHGGRNYFQWMSRGNHLREVMLPILDRHRPLLDSHARARLDAMRINYRLGGPGTEDTGEAAPAPPGEVPGIEPAPEPALAAAETLAENGSRGEWTPETVDPDV